MCTFPLVVCSCWTTLWCAIMAAQTRAHILALPQLVAAWPLGRSLTFPDEERLRMEMGPC